MPNKVDDVKLRESIEILNRVVLPTGEQHFALGMVLNLAQSRLDGEIGELASEDEIANKLKEQGVLIPYVADRYRVASALVGKVGKPTPSPMSREIGFDDINMLIERYEKLNLLAISNKNKFVKDILATLSPSREDIEKIACEFCERIYGEKCKKDTRRCLQTEWLKDKLVSALLPKITKCDYSECPDDCTHKDETECEEGAGRV